MSSPVEKSSSLGAEETTHSLAAASTPAGPQLSSKLLAYVFIVACVVLLGLMAYVVLFVVVPMTGTSSVFDELLAQYRASIKSDVESGKGVDKLTIDLVVILEYASADIRTAGVQIAFSLVAGVFFASIGILLFTAGITGALKVSGSHAGAKFDLATASPGIVCVLLGAAIIMVGVTKDVSRPLDASVKRGIGVSYGQTATEPPVATGGEATPEKSLNEQLPTEQGGGNRTTVEP